MVVPLGHIPRPLTTVAAHCSIARVLIDLRRRNSLYKKMKGVASWSVGSRSFVGGVGGVKEFLHALCWFAAGIPIQM